MGVKELGGGEKAASGKATPTCVGTAREAVVAAEEEWREGDALRADDKRQRGSEVTRYPDMRRDNQGEAGL